EHALARSGLAHQKDGTPLAGGEGDDFHRLLLADHLLDQGTRHRQLGRRSEVETVHHCAPSAELVSTRGRRIARDACSRRTGSSLANQSVRILKARSGSRRPIPRPTITGPTPAATEPPARAAAGRSRSASSAVPGATARMTRLRSAAFRSCEGAAV